MRNLGDMNDLYNSQNVIFRCEIGENFHLCMTNMVLTAEDVTQLVH